MSKGLLIAIDLINAFSPRSLYSASDLPVDDLTSEKQTNVNTLLHWGEMRELDIVFICDAHHPPDFKRLMEPPHALVGTAATDLMDWVYISPFAEKFYKRTYDGTTNPAVLSYLHQHQSYFIIIFGTSTGVCVKATMMGIYRAGFQNIYLIEDACADMFPSRHHYTLQKLRNSKVVQVVDTTEIMKKFDK